MKATVFTNHAADVFADYVPTGHAGTAYAIRTTDRDDEPHVIAWSDAPYPWGPWGPFVYRFDTAGAAVAVFAGDHDSDDDDYTYHACVAVGATDDEIRHEFDAATGGYDPG